MMMKRTPTISDIWFTIGSLFAGAGGLPLLGGSVSGTEATRAFAKLLVGVAAFGVAVWQRRRERKAIALGTMAPHDVP